jgi:hypothetical protein
MTKENLTGGQIQEIMDSFLYKALEPIVLHTDVFDSQLCYLLTAVIKNKKRRFCALDRNETIDHLSQAIITTDRVKKLELIKKLKIERSFIHVFVKKFLEEYRKPFLDLYYCYLSDSSKRISYKERMDPYVKEVGSNSIQDMFVSVTLPSVPLKQFYDYFSSIVDQYIKLSHTQAKHLRDTNTGNTYDYRDVVQNFMRNVVVALNKYDSSKGALTSYIKYWMLNSLTCNSSEHEYGIAYTIPQNQKKIMSDNKTSVNFSTSMDYLLASGEEDGDSTLHEILSAETEDLDEEYAVNSELRMLYLFAKRADPHGLARLYLDLPEVFTNEELKIMENLKSTKSVNK